MSSVDCIDQDTPVKYACLRSTINSNGMWDPVAAVLNWITRRRGFQPLPSGAEASLPTERHKDPCDRWCPEENASCFSRLLFSFVDGLIRLGYRKHLAPDDLWDISVQDEASEVAQKFKDELRKTKYAHAPQGSVLWTIARLQGRLFLVTGALKVVHDVIMFAMPALLQLLLTHLGNAGTHWGSLGIALAMFCLTVLETLTINQYFYMLSRASMHIKTGLIALLYDKVLRISTSAKSSIGVGTILNLQSNDAAKIWRIPQYLHIIWNGPFQIMVVMGMLVRVLRLLPSLSALMVTLLLIPISTLVGRALDRARRDMVQHTDARVKLASEIVTGVKAIKLYAWEDPYVLKISQLRERELRAVRRTQALAMINNVAYQSGPILVALAAFGTYTALGHTLTASVAFPALALFDLLRFPIVMFPEQLMNFIHARVGLQRIQKLLEAEEMDASRDGSWSKDPFDHSSDNCRDVKFSHLGKKAADRSSSREGVVGRPAGQDVGLSVVSINNADFGYSISENPILSNIDLDISPGGLVMVVGEVGSGKSSLLAAILGEISCLSGEVDVDGSVAYTAQDPWIQNCTLRDNVLMGLEYEDERYIAALSCCALGPDLELLPAGDASEIGEKGINLSGGQKHRVALARAVYAGAQLYLLDDPLSAVDAHVGRQIFDQCICHQLRKATRVLVTHQLQYLPSADLVVVMNQGRITHRGKYEELIRRGVDFHQYALHSHEEEETECRTKNVQGERDLTDEKLTRTMNSVEVVASSSYSSQIELGRLHEGRGDSNGHTLLELPPPCTFQEAHMAVTKIDAKAAVAEELSSAVSLSQGDPELDLVHLDAAGAPGGNPHMSTGTAGLSETSPGGTISSEGQEQQQEGLKVVLRARENTGDLAQAEDRAEGRVNKTVYKQYIAAWGPHFLLPLGMVAGATLEYGLQMGQNFVLSAWANETQKATKAGGPQEATEHNASFMGVYFVLGMASIAMGLVATAALVVGTINASRVLHQRLLKKVVRLPMSFFDSQPTGRLLNRFTKDTEAVDLELAETFQWAIICFIEGVLSTMVVLSVSPGTVLAIVPLAYIYFRVQSVFIATSRELKRLDSLAYSPIFQDFSETLSGLQTIRAFNCQGMFYDRHLIHMNSSNRAYWPTQVVNRWLSLRLELMGSIIILSCVVFVSVLLPRSAGLAGLALTSAVNLTGNMNWMVRQISELEVNMNAVERMMEYDKYQEEAPLVIPASRPPQHWPHQGAIQVDSLVVKYRPNLDPVLRGLTFSIKGGEKIGVCGRTGCGKSTLMMTLYRIVEPTSGRVVIDGVDTALIGLADLRSRLSLVPQDPVIFSGTIRSNLDPFGQAPNDLAIWEALRQAGMAMYVSELGQGLDSSLMEGGSNMSVGQRQLLCMARALLRASKIMVLDEATSNVDAATDSVIQQAVRAAFRDCTVLTIAHRLHTILDADRVLLLKAGEVGEFDSPTHLLQQTGGAFRAMMEEFKGGMQRI